MKTTQFTKPANELPAAPEGRCWTVCDECEGAAICGPSGTACNCARYGLAAGWMLVPIPPPSLLERVRTELERAEDARGLAEFAKADKCYRCGHARSNHNRAGCCELDRSIVDENARFYGWKPPPDICGCQGFLEQEPKDLLGLTRLANEQLADALRQTNEAAKAATARVLEQAAEIMKLQADLSTARTDLVDADLRHRRELAAAHDVMSAAQRALERYDRDADLAMDAARGFVAQHHRDCTGHNQCWQNNVRLWQQFGLVPHGPELPPRAEFEAGCKAFQEAIYADPTRWPDFVGGKK